MLVLVFFTNATLPNCGKLLTVSTTTFVIYIRQKEHDVTIVPNGKKVEDWTIRNQLISYKMAQRLDGSGGEPRFPETPPNQD